MAALTRDNRFETEYNKYMEKFPYLFPPDLIYGYFCRGLVRAYDTNGDKFASVLTRDDGTFLFDDLPEGSY